jgi:hypothetical protein
LAHGFRVAVLIAGIACALAGLLAAATIRNPPHSSRLLPHARRSYHCALEATPVQAMAVAEPRRSAGA